MKAWGNIAPLIFPAVWNSLAGVNGHKFWLGSWIGNLENTLFERLNAALEQSAWGGRDGRSPCLESFQYLVTQSYEWPCLALTVFLLRVGGWPWWSQEISSNQHVCDFVISLPYYKVMLHLLKSTCHGQELSINSAGISFKVHRQICVDLIVLIRYKWEYWLKKKTEFVIFMLNMNMNTYQVEWLSALIWGMNQREPISTSLSLFFFPEICTVVSALHCVWSDWSFVWVLKFIVARDLKQPFARNYFRPAGMLILETGWWSHVIASPRWLTGIFILFFLVLFCCVYFSCQFEYATLNRLG